MCKPATVQLDATGNVTVTSSDVDNGSFDNCVIVSYLIVPSNFDCDDLGANNVIMIVTDQANRSSNCIAAVTVADDDNPCVTCDPPVATCQDITVEIDSLGIGTLEPANINAGSAATCGLDKMEVSHSSFDCSDAQTTTTVTLYVIDIYSCLLYTSDAADE